MDTRITEEKILIEKITQYTKCFKEENHKFACQVDSCKSVLSDKSAAIRHLKSHHSEIVAAIQSHKTDSQNTDLIEIRVKINPSKVWDSILQMIVFGALSFTILNLEGFPYLLKPYVNAFKSNGLRFGVNCNSIQERLEQTAAEI